MGFLSCCRSSDDARDTSAFNNASTPSRSRIKTRTKSTTAIVPSTGMSTNRSTTTIVPKEALGVGNDSSIPNLAEKKNEVTLTDWSGREEYQDDEGVRLLFYDATSSFTDIVERLSYPPTKTMKRSVVLLDDGEPNTFNSQEQPQRGGGGAATGRRVSILEPQTLLSSICSTSTQYLSMSMEEHQEFREEEMDELHSQAIRNDKQHKGTMRESVIRVTHQLQQQTPGSRGRGYPGELKHQELDACLQFRQELKTRHSYLKQIVYAFAPMEEESFALCRVLRGEGFTVENVFRKFDQKQVVEHWERAKQHDFWSDLEDYFGCPLPVFLQLFPIVSGGLAKNGCTLLYLKASEINIDGIECIAELPSIMPYIWHILHEQSKVTMQREIERTDPVTTTVLAEKIAIVDMKDAPSALFGSRGMEFLKDAAKASACFPEVLNRMYVLNVPFSFTLVWAVLKLFLDTRTIQKIGFFSYASKAKNDLLEYVSSDQLLSDYGGNGLSFEELLETRQRECGEEFSRYVVKVMQIKPSSKASTFSFDLNEMERIFNVRVYSKDEVGAVFWLQCGNQLLAGPTTVNLRTAAATTSNQKRNHNQKMQYSAEILPLVTNNATTAGTPSVPITVYATVDTRSSSSVTTTARAFSKARCSNFLVAICIRT